VPALTVRILRRGPFEQGANAAQFLLKIGDIGVGKVAGKSAGSHILQELADTVSFASQGLVVSESGHIRRI
jgi:hypothetical protein